MASVGGPSLREPLESSSKYHTSLNLRQRGASDLSEEDGEEVVKKVVERLALLLESSPDQNRGGIDSQESSPSPPRR